MGCDWILGNTLSNLYRGDVIVVGCLQDDDMNVPLNLKELSARESAQVEWKENVADTDDVVATLSAFANDLANLGGGYVVCGAKEEKDEHGFQRVVMTGLTANRLKEVEGKVLTACRDRVSPSIAPLVDELATDSGDRRVLVFSMPASRKAHLFRRHEGAGKYFVRIGRETREARNGIMLQLLVHKGDVEEWDRRECKTATVDDLDLLALRVTLQELKLYDPDLGVDPYLSDTKALHWMVPPLCFREPLTGILRPRNFAILLFGKDVQRHIPGAFALFSVYRGIDRAEVPYSERNELGGTLIDQAGRLRKLLSEQITIAMDKTNLQSPNTQKYPQLALHEAMINALAHRDYEVRDPTRITCFADRIEMVSPGSLPLGVEVEDFVRGKARPIWRNQSLAWILTKLQFAQNEGQGIQTILRTMENEGCPPPLFEVTGNHVVCLLPANVRHRILPVPPSSPKRQVSRRTGREGRLR